MPLPPLFWHGFCHAGMINGQHVAGQKLFEHYQLKTSLGAVEWEGEKSWIEIFEKGLAAFRAGEFTAAREYMNLTREMRGGSHGPSEFYLR